MPFGTREKDSGEPIPATRFGMMGDPDAHADPDAPNPVEMVATDQLAEGDDSKPLVKDQRQTKDEEK